MQSAFLTAFVDGAAAVLLHSLWQGAVVGLLYALTMLYLRDASPRLRYGAAVGWLVVLAVCPLLTAFLLIGSDMGLPGSAFALPSTAAREVALAAQLGPLWVALWFAGVLMLSARLAWGWRRAVHLTLDGCLPLDFEWEQRLKVLARQIGVSRPVRLVESVVVSVPTVIGWLRPVILLPSSALLGLSQRQLELVIAHELAHIARYDYGVNYLLVAVETVWFHHPAVYLIGRGIREERELCCDDLVISRCGSRYEYVTALTDLETLRSRHLLSEPLSNIAATGGNLLHRVQRIVKGQAPRPGSLYFGGVAVILTALLSAVSLYAPTDQPGAQLISTVPLTRARPNTPGGPIRIEPIETIVRAPALRPGLEWVADSRSLAMIEAPSLPAVQRDAGQPVLLRTANSAQWDGLPPKLLSARDPGVATPASVQLIPPVEPAGPTRIMKAELDLASPMIESLSDLRRDASLALAATGASYSSPKTDNATVGGELVVAEASVSEVGGELVKRIEPRYPNRARMRGYTDTVQIEFTVTDTGEVGDIRIVSDQSRRVFERAVVDAVSKWRYEPLLRNGVPVERKIVETFAFRLSGSEQRGFESGCRRDASNRLSCTGHGLNGALTRKVL